MKKGRFCNCTTTFLYLNEILASGLTHFFGGIRLACTHDVMLVVTISSSMVQCSMDTLKFVCSWHGGVPGAKLSVKVCSDKLYHSVV